MRCVVICLERGADLHMAQLMPLPLTVSCFRLVLPFWYRLTWVVPEKGPLNGCVCVCACVRACMRAMRPDLYSYVDPKNNTNRLTDPILYLTFSLCEFAETWKEAVTLEFIPWVCLTLYVVEFI